eukprot:GDKK01011597.1.p1 GENE.GDKK01011597.1~~GDKK01011597.1.p1  ORF type:complete len:135 (-),score=1.58 GDKK01011597.1:129-533(-)
MLMWRWMRSTDYNMAAAKNAMYVTMAVESFFGFKYPPNYQTFQQQNPEDFATGTVCKCHPGTAEYRRQYKLCLGERLAMAGQLFAEGFAPDRRRPSKRGVEPVPRASDESEGFTSDEELALPPHKPFVFVLPLE